LDPDVSKPRKKSSPCSSLGSIFMISSSFRAPTPGPLCPPFPPGPRNPTLLRVPRFCWAPAVSLDALVSRLTRSALDPEVSKPRFFNSLIISLGCIAIISDFSSAPALDILARRSTSSSCDPDVSMPRFFSSLISSLGCIFIISPFSTPIMDPRAPGQLDPRRPPFPPNPPALPRGSARAAQSSASRSASSALEPDVSRPLFCSSSNSSLPCIISIASFSRCTMDACAPPPAPPGPSNPPPSHSPYCAAAAALYAGKSGCSNEAPSPPIPEGPSYP